jgi:hypothetical protein
MHMIQSEAPWAPPWPPPTGEPASTIRPRDWPFKDGLARYGPRPLCRDNRHWKHNEVETLVTLLVAGHDLQLIADHLGRTRWGVQGRCRDMGIRPQTVIRKATR